MAHPYLTTRKTTRQLYFRRAVPSDLRAILPREIWISLATPCRRTALTRLARAAVWFEETLEQARRQLGGGLTGKGSRLSPSASHPPFLPSNQPR